MRFKNIFSMNPFHCERLIGKDFGDSGKPGRAEFQIPGSLTLDQFGCIVRQAFFDNLVVPKSHLVVRTAPILLGVNAVNCLQRSCLLRVANIKRKKWQIKGLKVLGETPLCGNVLEPALAIE